VKSNGRPAAYESELRVIEVVATEIVDLVPFAPEAMYGLTTIIPLMIRLAPRGARALIISAPIPQSASDD
jgi:hypothetical protein